jgi:ketosteroid isomerase-like protein
MAFFQNRVARFTRLLQEFEKSGNSDALVGLFANDCELSRLGQSHREEGSPGARAFWQQYLESFRRVHSRFTHTADEGNLSILEWVSDGELPAGTPVRYRGVSLLQWNGDRIARFATYFDSASLLATSERLMTTDAPRGADGEALGGPRTLDSDPTQLPKTA